MSDIERSGLLPVVADYAFTGADGVEYSVEIEVFATHNLAMFSEGVSATFRLFRIQLTGERQLIYLIDNHAPYGFHEQDGLPVKHDSRVPMHVRNWREAWERFQQRYRELTK